MPWTFSRFEPEHLDLIEAYLGAVGRALCLASHFEEQCNHILRVIRITDAARDGKSFDEIREVALGFRRKLLAATIDDIGKAEDFDDEDIQTLVWARVSRNYIAHEAATLGPLDYVREEDIRAKCEELLPHVRNVIAGEDLVSSWAYEIQEKEPAPSGFRATYPARMVGWVFGPLYPD